MDIVRGFKSTEGNKKIEGIEVKYFKNVMRSRGSVEGIGQALGLLLLGFDFVTIYHVFYQEFDEEKEYGL